MPTARDNPDMRGLAARIAGYCASHWDINAVWQLRHDVRAAMTALASDSGGLAALRGIDAVLDACLAGNRLPDPDERDRLQDLAGRVEVPQQAAAPAAVETDVGLVQAAPVQTSAEQRFETPPLAYWRQWSDGAEAPVPPAGPGDAPAPNPNQTPARTASMNDSSARKLGNGETRLQYQRIYHLTGNGALSLEVDQLLDQAGLNLELLDSEDDLAELLQALPADLLLVDAEFADRIDKIGALIAGYRRQNPKYLTAVQILPADMDAATATERFAMMDALINGSADARGVIARIDQILRFGKSDRYRVLIVEDDRSQAMFAEGILRNAEIGTKVLLDATNLLPTVKSFKPDLILMDLNMPGASGIELTELLRQSSEFRNIPIVFLSGESDEDRQMDALEAGGDDFLEKPIRPRRLIAAVQNRIKRHRALQGGNGGQQTHDSGLIRRSDMLRLLEARIGAEDQALLFIEINGMNLLKDRLGLSELESLMQEFSAFLAQACDPRPVARFGDASYALLYQGDCGDAALTAYAEDLRRRVMAQKFEIKGQSVEFRLQIGVCRLAHAKGSTGILINAGERIARQARGEPSGVAVFTPQSSSEVLREEALIRLMADAGHNNCLAHIYQPIVAVAGGSEKQFQTLLRMRDGDGNLVPAAEFIPIAERSDLIVTVDRWSIAKAVSTLAERQAGGDPIKLFVNQSSITLLDEGQSAWLKNLLKAHSIPQNSLVIEINHNDALLNQQSIREFCQGLIYDGVQFCLSRYNPRNDDADLLESLPISYVKLADRLTSDLARQEIRDQIKTLADDAHRRGVEVIGHCIEDAQSAATLWMSGIDFIQGNLVHSASASLEFGFDQSVL
ncbi:MAG: EAL domain-containing protein [Arenimonas sp.]